MINIIANTLSYRFSSGKTWYVRPSGSTYGSSNGTTYANAWSGFANINNAVINPGDTIYIAGTHNQSLIVNKNGITLRGDYNGDSGIINGGNVRTSCISISSLTGVKINSIVLRNATVSCLNLDSATGITTNNINCSFSGNQGIQHLGITTAVHNSPILIGSTDDGISVHDSGNILIYNGFFSGNTQQVNIVGKAKITLFSPVFSGTSQYDLYATQADVDDDCIITAYNTKVRNIDANIGARIILNDSRVDGTTSLSTSTGNGSIVANRTIFNGGFTIGVGGTATLTNCRISTITSNQGSLILSKSYVKDEISVGGSGTLVAEYSMFDGTGLATHLIDGNSGSTVQVKYSIFKNMPVNQFGINFRTGVNALSYANNCTFVGTANVGRGIFSQVNLTTNNNIYYDLAIGYFRTLGTSILNNSCFFDCTTPKSGTVTSNNEQIGDPLFVNAGVDDYRLLAGSSCIDNGLTLGSEFNTGILSANWGSSTTVPVVETTIQSGSWNIGAFV
jgi:hypothetical protein